MKNKEEQYPSSKNWRTQFVNRFDRHEDFHEIYEELTKWIEKLVKNSKKKGL